MPDEAIPTREELSRLMAQMKAELAKPAMTRAEEFDFLYNPDSEDRAAFEDLSVRINRGLKHHGLTEADSEMVPD